MPAPYAVDSSVWITMRKNSPPDIFKTLWSNIDEMIDAGDICSPEMVLVELQRGTDELAATLKAKSGLFVPIDGAMATAVTKVLAICPTLADVESPKNEADPFVVALAMMRNCTVLCQERRAKSAHGRQRIPDACDTLGITCMGWQDFIREMGWTF